MVGQRSDYAEGLGRSATVVGAALVALASIDLWVMFGVAAPETVDTLARFTRVGEATALMPLFFIGLLLVAAGAAGSRRQRVQGLLALFCAVLAIVVVVQSVVYVLYAIELRGVVQEIPDRLNAVNRATVVSLVKYALFVVVLSAIALTGRRGAADKQQPSMIVAAGSGPESATSAGKK